MARATLPQFLFSLLVILLFAPVYLSSGSAAFRSEWLSFRAGGLPVISWLVIALIAIFVALVVAFSMVAFGAEETPDQQLEDGQ